MAAAKQGQILEHMDEARKVLGILVYCRIPHSVFYPNNSIQILVASERMALLVEVVRLVKKHPTTDELDIVRTLQRMEIV